jgi:hypothetical protein
MDATSTAHLFSSNGLETEQWSIIFLGRNVENHEIYIFYIVGTTIEIRTAWTKVFYEDRVTAQDVSRRLIIAEARVRTQVTSCWIRGGQSGARPGFLLSVAFHLYYICARVSSGGWTQGSLATAFPDDLTASQQ